MSNPFAGTWTYRSFLNDPGLVGDDKDKLEALLFAEGVWTVEDTAVPQFKGVLSFGPGEAMDLTGMITVEPGRPAHVHINGKGRPGTDTEHYFYDYDGSLTEHWPNGVKQVPAITGSTIRVKPHDGKPAGVVASIIVVKAGLAQQG
ncbi:hypothetical protein [Granulicella mallensis]|uniref:Uncharacterized protein n=1 Tax=Granulicella mallensis (strain ATCC BAA-1857 / DSM 23137 / MP5ACTX8) TaxID=682795 RepID=G8NX87_GRAMM|nr:hypothetical protein [Granulicella mallensis]AEU36701.1 hypothetical protein AciX8_2384 [Granulicella mallensis MP5ACTX8]